MNDLQDNLNAEQRLAAQFTGKHLIVLAGAGTGKTRTIIARASFLLSSGISPSRILILSFTRKSAREIVERIKADLSEKSTEGLKGQTFHSWCMDLIQQNRNIFSQSDFTLIDEEDRESCFKLICGKNLKDKENHTVKVKNVVDIYSYCINTSVSLSTAMRIILFDNADMSDKVVTESIEKNKPIYADLIRKYIVYKNNRRYLDYDDLLLIVARILKANAGARDFISKKYDHILVDEMQDTNPLQYQLLSSFYDNCHLFCVGDDAQSIYGFRGADFQSMHHFTEIVPDSTQQKLTLNYRSTQEILDLSNWLLKQSSLNYEKDLVAFRGKGLIPLLVHWENEWEEANDVTDRIIESVMKRNELYIDNMVLSRSVWGLKKTEACCIKKKIPYAIFGGSGLMQSRHIRDLAAPLRIIANFHDELAWMRFLMLWPGIGEVTATKIIGYVIDKVNLEECIYTLMGLNIPKEISETLLAISNLQYNVSEAIAEALRVMEKRLAEIYKDNNWESRKSDFELLQEVALDTASIAEFVAEYVLDPKLETTRKGGGKDADHVILSTIHSAKGLEAKNCYVLNVSTFSFPSKKAILNGEESIEEERRCLYVALTRAKDRLCVYRDIHSVHADSKIQSESYFLNSLDEKLVQKVVLPHAQYFEDTFYEGEKIDIDIYDDFDFS
ncbi:MAG: ATP-dependent helicase [Muribaculaceae bacterium]|nr:ATP-dependent helicase [Muribaculaceae bacterium]